MIQGEDDRNITDKIAKTLDRHEGLLLQGKNSIERDIITSHYLSTLLKNDQGILLILGSEPASEGLLRYARYVPEIMKAYNKGHVWVIDWFEWRSGNISSVQEKGEIISCDRDTYNISVAFELIRNRPKKRHFGAVIDIISPVFSTFESSLALSYVQSLISKFESRNIPALFLIDTDCHQANDVSNIQNMFKSYLDIKYRTEKSSVRSSLAFIPRGHYGVKYKDFFIREEGIQLGRGSSTSLKTLVKNARSSNWRFLPTGLRSLDRVLGGGVVQNKGCLFEGAGEGAYRKLAYQIMRYWGDLNRPLLFVTGTETPNYISDTLFENRLEKLAHDRKVAVVDWYNWRMEKIMTVDSGNGIYRCGKDVSNLLLGINMAISHLSHGDDSKNIVAMVDVLSPAAQIFDYETISGLLYSLRAKFLKSNITPIFILDRTAFDEREVSDLRYIFDMLLGTSMVKEGSSVFPLVYMVNTPLLDSSRDLMAIVPGSKIRLVPEEEMRRKIRYRESKKDRSLDPEEFDRRCSKLRKLIKSTKEIVESEGKKLLDRDEIDEIISVAEESLRTGELSYATNTILNARRKIKSQTYKREKDETPLKQWDMFEIVDGKKEDLDDEEKLVLRDIVWLGPDNKPTKK